MDQASQRGWPLVRHPVLHFPDDPVLRGDRTSAEGGEGRIRAFMLGADWIIFPVLTPGALTVRAYVPSGRWLPLWPEAYATATPSHTAAAAAPATSTAASTTAAAAAAAAATPLPSVGAVVGPGWHVLPAPLGQPAVYHREEAPSALPIRSRLSRLGVPCAPLDAPPPV